MLVFEIKFTHIELMAGHVFQGHTNIVISLSGVF